MSIFGNNDKNYLYEHIVEFLEDHKVSELLHVVEIAIEKEEEE